MTQEKRELEYKWLNKDSRTFLERGYLEEGVTPEQRVRQIAEHAESILKIDGFADKFEYYMSKGFYSLATPIWTNFGLDRGYPVSCFGSYVDDDMKHIMKKVGEVGLMSKVGGGTSAFFGKLRPRGATIKNNGESGGPVHFLDLLDVTVSSALKEFIQDGGKIANVLEFFDATADCVSQGSARRGSFAAYLPVEHDDIEEFLQIRSTGHKIQNMSIGVTITNKWMEEMILGDKAKRKIWGSIIKKRCETGYPYLQFADTVNDNAPQVYKDKGMWIYNSNLCTEIELATDINNSFVCVISSTNVLHWDEIKNTDAVKTMIYLLDAVNSDFVRLSEGVEFMDTAHNFAKSQRAVGLGVLGWHSYLQSKMIPFESLQAKMENNMIFKTIREQAEEATKELAELFGEPELLKGYGRRNTTLLAVAPTTSSSFILGQVSPSIEPENSCYYVKKLAKGSFTYKNPYLKKLLKEKDKNEDEVWDSILIHGGSVQHLDFLSQDEKDVFKTFGEISQKEIIIQAASRQKWIDQSQSLNLMIPPDVKAKDISDLYIEGWKMGIKTFYYQRSANPSQQLARNILNCVSCEG